MIALNPNGISACLTPGTRGSNGAYTCDVLIFNEYSEGSALPNPETLEAIISETDLLAAFGESLLYRFNGLTITTTFNWGINERSFKKTPVDALPFTPTKNGKIGWIAIKFPGDRFMFLDSIGTWSDIDKCIGFSSLTCDTNTINNLKDINIIVRDESTYAKYPNGIFGENGPYHLVPETDIVPTPESEPQGE